MKFTPEEIRKIRAQYLAHVFAAALCAPDDDEENEEEGEEDED